MHQSTIDQLAVHVGSGVTPRGGSESYSNDGVIFIRSQNVRSEGLDLHDVAYIDLKTHESMRRSEVFAGDVLLNITGASIGRCCVVPAGIGAANVNQHVCAIRLPSPTEPDASFLAHVLASHIGQSQIDRLNAGGNREGLNYQQLRAFTVPWPSAAERVWIAAVLDTIDDAIQKTEQIIAKLQQVKQGLLHDLLTRGIDDNGELRDPERHPEQFQDSPLGRIPKGWEVEKLRVLYSEPSRNGLYKGPAYHGRGAPMIQMGNLFASDEVSFSDTGRVSVSESELRTFGLRVGDILFARRSLVFEGAGRAAVVGVVPEPATFESSIVRVRLRTERILPRFAVTYLASHQGYLRRRAHIRQVAVSGVSGTDIASFLMAIPTLSEQQTIVETKAILDLQIENEARARGALMSMKNGLADDLLTGRVRTTSLPEFSA